MPKISKYLMYSALIPFVLCTIFLLLPFDITAQYKDQALLVISSYSILIISFLSGSIWNYQFNLNNFEKIQFYLCLFSNIIPIIAWISFFIFSYTIQMLVFLVLFLVLLSVDHYLYTLKQIKKSYLMMRYYITGIVTVLLFISWFVQ